MIGYPYFFSGEKDIILLGDFNLEPDKEGEALALGQCECWSICVYIYAQVLIFLGLKENQFTKTQIKI